MASSSFERRTGHSWEGSGDDDTDDEMPEMAADTDSSDDGLMADSDDESSG